MPDGATVAEADTIYMPRDTSASKALTLLPASQVSTIISLPGAQDILDKLLEDLADYEPDGSTEAGRKEAGSKARKIGTAKMDLIRLANKEMEDAQTKVKAVKEQIKIVETRMDAERDRINKVVEDYKAIEAARVAAHESLLAEVTAWGNVPDDWTAAKIAAFLEHLDSSPLLTRQWQEFHAKAQTAVAASVSTLRRRFAESTKREAEAAELERLRAAEAERQRQEAARQQAEREAEIARQAAETARVAAEEAAAQKAKEAERAAQRADYHRRMLQHVKNCGFGFIDSQPQPIGLLQYELTTKIKYDEENFGDLLPAAIAARDEALNSLQRSIDEANRRHAQEEAAQREREAAAEALARAEREKAAAIAETERRRIADHQQVLTRIRGLGRPPASETTASNIAAAITALASIDQGGRDWEEFEAEAVSAIAASYDELRRRFAEAQRREADEAAAIEAARLAEAERRELAAAEAAATAERARAQREQAAEDAATEKRAANRAHQARIHNEALEDLMKVLRTVMPLIAGGAEEPASQIAKEIVKAIARNDVRHCSFKY